MIYRITACWTVLMVLSSATFCPAAATKPSPLGTREQIESLREVFQREPYRSTLAHVDEWLALPINPIENAPDPAWAYEMQWKQEQAQFALAKYIATGQQKYADGAVSRFDEWVRVYGEHLALPKSDANAMRTSRQVQPECMLCCGTTTLGLLNDQQRADAQHVLKLCATAARWSRARSSTSGLLRGGFSQFEFQPGSDCGYRLVCAGVSR